MKIVEKDFILEPSGLNHFDLSFLKKIKKETGEVELKFVKVAYGCSLSSAIKKIVHNRVNTKYESESPYLLDYLKDIKNEYEQIQKLLNER